ncbi:hypothetical protein AAES_33342 [Amazona aestiva]|uniref:Uncharacterized protein n=1 Tax=Amazona aestiva TaxID=12930 RepID=A0A0Q3R1L1_AMAAE|nr:hypothetical protein AAES_33342 [Amazona aestiva]
MESEFISVFYLSLRTCIPPQAVCYRMAAGFALVDMMLRQEIPNSGLPVMSAIVIYNDTVLWTGNFGKKNGSDPSSVVPNEYTIYRSAQEAAVYEPAVEGRYGR